MEEGFYKPDLSAFHQGFEYEMEVQGSKPTKWIKVTWSELDSPKDQFDVELSYGEVTRITIPDCIRVKHLNREDMEDLKFRCTLKDGIIYCVLEANPEKPIYLDYNQETHLCKIHDIDDNLFLGTILNLSVLKQILKMIL